MAQNRKASPDGTGKSPNAQQVRDDIDAGRTRDKVDHPDPATAPLGTDAEAGGAPASAQSNPTDRVSRADDRRADDRRARGAESRNVARPGLIAVVVAIVLIAGIGWYFAAL